LNPRKADLHRWRETFAERLRNWGVDAEASRQATRGQRRDYAALWQVKAHEDGRLRVRGRPNPSSKADRTQLEAIDAWRHIGSALAASPHQADRELAADISRFLRTPTVRTRDERGRSDVSRDRQLDLGRSSVPPRVQGREPDLSR
jgi:hypothetical protein